MSKSIKDTGMPTPSAHAIGRFVAQWVLPVVAVVILFMILRGSVMAMGTLKGMFVFDGLVEASDMPYETMQGLNRLTPDERLILFGDRTRATTLEREKAIWEKWPTNIVYLHNYITQLAASAQYRRTDGETEEERRTGFAQEITQLQPRDPGNARMDYLLAGNLLAQAIKDQYSQTNADGTVTNKWGMSIVDRAKLDQAMAHFRTGLGKPAYRRYAGEMATERLAIMGEPTTLVKQIAEIGMVASVLCPDLSLCRELGRTSMAYAGLLIDDGRTQEAREFLAACRQFVPQINRDAYTLIDVLVVGAVAGIVAEQEPVAYERLGDSTMAHQEGTATAALARPVKDWKYKAHELSDSDGERMIHRHGGILAGLLLPALGEYPSAADLAPSRLLEYVVAERIAVAVLSLCLIVLMGCCSLLGLHYHVMSKTAPRSVYLLARGGDWGRLLSWGVLLPVLCYYGLTRWAPWCSRGLSPAIAYPQLITQFIALFLVVLAVMVTMVSQRVRRGCRDLGLPNAPAVPVFWRAWGLSLVGIPVLLSAVPESWLTAENMPGHAWMAYLPATMGGALVLSGLAYLIYGIAKRKWFARTYAPYYGSLARTLIPAVALAAIVLNAVAQPYLSREERHWMATDTVMRVDAKGGFTAIESRLVQRLKAEMQQAAARTPRSGEAPHQ